jgi:hypothetical protein
LDYHCHRGQGSLDRPFEEQVQAIQAGVPEFEGGNSLEADLKNKIRRLEYEAQTHSLIAGNSHHPGVGIGCICVYKDGGQMVKKWRPVRWYGSLRLG